MKSKYAKVGDTVRIINPNAFIRCGYALTHDILCDKHSDQVYSMADKLYALLYDLPPFEKATDVVDSPLGVINIGASNLQDKEHRVYTHLVSAVCSKLLRDLKWGGKERKVFEEPIESYRLRTKEPWKVESKRFVKTGTHYSSRTSWSWDGDPDYEPGGLSDEKTHCVYKISSDRDWLEIVATNCEVIALADSPPKDAPLVK